MTIIMTFIGTIVFAISLFTVGFKSAFKRLLAMAGVGALIDICILVIAAVFAGQFA